MLARLLGVATISPVELLALVERRAVTAIDVNARSSWVRARVPGALTLDRANYQARDLPARLDAPIVFYCSNPLCSKAPLAARRAKGFGYTNVRVMSAGISGWLAADLPTESGE
jgi:rhodanese-related sulfurtransferase